MRIKISLEGHMWEIPAEQFSIDGSDEIFAVHTTAPLQIIQGHQPPLSASHAETGFRIASGNTIEEAIENARDIWTGKTPKERTAAIASAHRLNKKLQGA